MSRGFTLLEVIVAMSVVAIVGALLFAILVNSTGLFYQQSVRLSQGLGINDSLSNIRVSLKKASSVFTGYPPTGTPQYSSSSSAIVLQLPAIDLQGNKIFNVWDYIVYTLDSGRLYYKVFPDTANGSVRQAVDQILTLNVYSIKFEYFDTGGNSIAPTLADKVRVTLTLRQKAGKSQETNIATSEANLRND